MPSRWARSSMASATRSSPDTATRATGRPSWASATAWFAPWPPRVSRRIRTAAVEPGSGMPSTRSTTSRASWPTTTTRQGVGTFGAPPSVTCESARHVVELVGVGPGPPLLAAVQVAEVAHRVGVELEVEELEVLLHAGRRHGLGEDHVATLDVPAEHDLRGRPVQPLGDPLHDLVVEHGA